MIRGHFLKHSFSIDLDNLSFQESNFSQTHGGAIYPEKVFTIFCTYQVSSNSGGITCELFPWAIRMGGGGGGGGVTGHIMIHVIYVVYRL